MAFFGPQKIEMKIPHGGNVPDAEGLMILLRGSEVQSILTEHGWEPAERADVAQVAQGFRRYVYPVVDVPGASIEYRAMTQPHGRYRGSMIFRGDRGALDEAGRAVALVARLVESSWGVAPRLKGLPR